MIEKEKMGDRIKRAREKMRFSQKEAAARIGIHNSTLGKYELGEREPDIETIRKLAELYEVPPEWLVFGITQNVPRGSLQENIELLEKEAEKMGLSVDDPVFKKMLFNALELIGTARRKDFE